MGTRLNASSDRMTRHSENALRRGPSDRTTPTNALLSGEYTWLVCQTAELALNGLRGGAAKGGGYDHGPERDICQDRSNRQQGRSRRRTEPLAALGQSYPV